VQEPFTFDALPRETRRLNSMNETGDMQSVIDEICAIDPSYRADLRGSDDEVIARLEAASGRLLPAIYRSFLRTMGEEWGIPFPKAEFRPARLIDYFETMTWRPPAGFTMIGDDNTGSSEDYFLDARNSPPAVVLFPKGTDPTEEDADLSYYEFESPSLPHFVFRLFFYLRYLEGSPYYIDASKPRDDEGAYAMANEVLSRMGLSPHPRSGHGYQFYVTPAVSVAVSQPAGYGMGVDVGGSDAKQVERIFAVLQDHINLFVRSRR
jgi:hypothetical protein